MIGENYCGMTSGNLKGEDMKIAVECVKLRLNF